MPAPSAICKGKAIHSLFTIYNTFFSLNGFSTMDFHFSIKVFFDRPKNDIV